MAQTMRRYLAQRRTTVSARTHDRDDRVVRHFGVFLAERYPDVERIAQVRREHVEAFKSHLASRPLLRPGPGRGKTLHKQTISHYLSGLGVFFDRLTESGDDDRPQARLLFPGDYPRLDRPLPRFLDDPSAAKLLAAARDDSDLFSRLVVELLARTGLRLGELRRLSLDAVVQIGSAYWLRVPVGKLRNDRYVPLHPELKTLIDQWLAQRGETSRHPLLFVTARGWPISNTKIEAALARNARRAGIGHVTPHQLRHTLATQAVNRGMSLDAIAALLGHRDMSMTMVYARIADRTVADQYFAVSEKVEALYQQPKQLPASAE
ncbi:MAG: tyrosine-type recombinase/integrase, partial [Acidobacteriota bacterium]|nr:tyrosine-type recombinase/integrase [Acidobacteriota bacterium]